MSLINMLSVTAPQQVMLEVKVAEVARTVLLHAPISELTIAAFQRDVRRMVNRERNIFASLLLALNTLLWAPLLLVVSLARFPLPVAAWHRACTACGWPSRALRCRVSDRR